MSNIGNFKRVGREVVYKGKILEFCQDEIQTSKGHHGISLTTKVRQLLCL